MGVMSFVRNMLGVETDPEIEEVEQQEAAEPKASEPPVVRPAPQPVVRMVEERRGRTNHTMSNENHAQMVLFQPSSYEEAPAIADHLCQGHTAVLNLESADRETKRRLVDFLSGVAYANRGAVKRVAKETFLITPENIDMHGDLVDEVDPSGIY